jgi:MtaA/CmuA family methyltransferase
MTGKQRIISAFKRLPVDRTPWVPFAGVHCAFLTGLPADEYLKRKQNIVSGVGKAVELYEPDGMPVMFDLQIEAEALGCKLRWAIDNPPAVISHPLEEGVSLEQLPAFNKDSARIPVCTEAASELRAMFPDIALYGLVTGPFTLAVHLAGTNIFMQMMEAPDEVAGLLNYCRDITKKMAGWYLEAGCDVIAVVDPMTSQVDPMSFEQHISKPITEVFDHIRELQGLSSFFVCGFAQHNIEAMCKCKPDNISIDENIPLDYVRVMAEKYNISFGGNLKLTSVLSLGSVEDVKKHTLDTLATGGEKGFVIAPGCDLVMDTPVENLQAVTRSVAQSAGSKSASESDKSVARTETGDLASRHQPDKVIIDIITLDSSSCAPCQYMVEAVSLAAKGFGDQVECKECSIKTREGLQLMEMLGVKNVPVTVIDGEISFVSNIPPKDVIEKAILKKLQSKGLIK